MFKRKIMRIKMKFWRPMSEFRGGTSLPLKYLLGKNPSFGLVECLAEIPRTSRALFLISAVKQYLE